MKKLLINARKGFLVFDEFDFIDDLENLNKTNVISTSNLKFTNEYITKNIELVASFLSVMCQNEGISKVLIKDFSSAGLILDLLKYLPEINQVIFKTDDSLNMVLWSKIISNKYIEYVNCFTLPSYIFNTPTNIKITTRSELLSLSEFLSINKLNTYSDMYYCKSIYINKNFTKNNLVELDDFLNINNKLKVINIELISIDLFKNILKVLQKNRTKNIRINILQGESNNEVLFESVNLLKKFIEKYKIKIKIIYSKEYKEKFVFKQLQFNAVRILICMMFVLTIGSIYLIKRSEKLDIGTIENVTNRLEKLLSEDIIEEKNEEVEESQEPKSPSISFNSSDNGVNSDTPSNSGGGKASNKKYSSNSTYNELLSINPDTIGWIYIPGTKVNYPYVQASDNKFYLNHSYDKTNSKAGWIFADYRCDFDDLSKNIILYGHNYNTSGIMFGSLEKVIDNQTWLGNKNNHYISFTYKGVSSKWEIFSMYIVPKTNDYLYVNFETDGKFLEFANKMKNRSDYNFNVELSESDHMLTLSTCHNNSSTERLVVHAKKIA